MGGSWHEEKVRVYRRFSAENYNSSALQPLSIMNYPVSGVRLGLIFKAHMFSDLKYSLYHDIWSRHVRIFPLSRVAMLTNVCFLQKHSRIFIGLASPSIWHSSPWPNAISNAAVNSESECVFRNEAFIRRWFDLLQVRGTLESSMPIHWTITSAIFAVTLVLTIMIIAAPPGLKNIVAQYVPSFNLMCSVLMTTLE